MNDKNPLAGMVSAAAEQLHTPTKAPAPERPPRARPSTTAKEDRGRGSGAVDVDVDGRPPAQRRRRVRYEDRYRRATFFFDPDQLDRLDQFAYDRNLSKSEIIRTALDEYLNRG